MRIEGSRFDQEIVERLEVAEHTAKRAGLRAKQSLTNIKSLKISKKGDHDWVSEVDVDIECYIRESIAMEYPEDSIVGEEGKKSHGSSGYTWVIDPIDGTSNFISNIPCWCVVIACIENDTTILGVVYDPNADELYSSRLNHGAFLNGKRLLLKEHCGLQTGRVGLGVNSGGSVNVILKMAKNLERVGSEFYRNGSGALMLCYVASGRLIGYFEPHMNAWDCLAAHLMIVEAGGLIEQGAPSDTLLRGQRVIVGNPLVFPVLKELAESAFGSG